MTTFEKFQEYRSIIKPNVDKDYLVLPTHIVDVSSDDLANYFNTFTQNKLYLRSLLIDALYEEEDARQDYYIATKSQYVDMARMSEAAKERILSQQAGIADIYKKYADAKLLRQSIEHKIDDFADAIFFISREISRRRDDFKENSRQI